MRTFTPLGTELRSRLLSLSVIPPKVTLPLLSVSLSGAALLPPEETLEILRGRINGDVR